MLMTRLFGTNGVRGVINKDMSVELALDVGRAIGTFMQGRVAIATDSRTSGDMLRSLVAGGMLSAGSSVVDLGMLPTPALQYYVRNSGVKGGVMITASHNPPEFNGIKCVDHDGTEMPRRKEEVIERIYNERSFTSPNWKDVGRITYLDGVASSYTNAIRRAVDRFKIEEARLNVVLDCANGAGAVTSPGLLDSLGVRAITLNGNPQGTFPGHPSEPTPENLRDLAAVVKATGADLGIAHDGDADRTIFVDDKGNYVHGDQSLTVVASHMVQENQGGIVVTPVSTSSCLEEVVRRHNGQVIYTKVGAPIVARRMMEVNAVFGGEENGGLIFPEHQYCRDGAMAMAKMLEVIASRGPLSELLKEVPRFCLDKRKLTCPEEKKAWVLEQVEAYFADRRTDLTDGIKIFFEGGWSLVRPSGTEPIFRIYSEGRDEAEAKRCGDECEKVVRELLEE